MAAPPPSVSTRRFRNIGRSMLAARRTTFGMPFTIMPPKSDHTMSLWEKRTAVFGLRAYTSKMRYCVHAVMLVASPMPSIPQPNTPARMSTTVSTAIPMVVAMRTILPPPFICTMGMIRLYSTSAGVPTPRPCRYSLRSGSRWAESPVAPRASPMGPHAKRNKSVRTSETAPPTTIAIEKYPSARLASPSPYALALRVCIPVTSRPLTMPASEKYGEAKPWTARA